MTYEATHHFAGGGSVSGSSSIVAAAARIDRSMADEQRAWIAHLRGLGVKLAHPDDGWVDRVRHVLQPSYPQFNLHPDIGDTICLGQPWQESRIVTLTDPTRLPWSERDPAFLRRKMALARATTLQQKAEIMAAPLVTDHPFEPYTHCPLGHRGEHEGGYPVNHDGRPHAPRTCWCGSTWLMPLETP